MSKTILFKCPYCDNRFTKEELVDHIGDNHDDLIPRDYSPFRVAYDAINLKPVGFSGKCCICSKRASFDDAKGKYNKTCNNKDCKIKYLKKISDMKAFNPNFETVEGQTELLGKRKISGVYKMSDGVEKQYTGSYEKACLEFLDKVIKCRSEDILAPGISIEYEYEGKKHTYISDFFYIPYHLIIEVKDGGDNPNRKNMIEYRKKQTAKEKSIIVNTDYNYIRLTDNDFSQLLAVFFELKIKYLDENNKERVIRINE